MRKYHQWSIKRYTFKILKIIIIIIYSLQQTLVVFHFSLSDQNSLQISWILFSILANFNRAIVWIVSIHPPNSNNSNFLSNLLGSISNTPFTIGITITLMFSGKVQVFVYPFGFFYFHSVVCWNRKIHSKVCRFFLLIIITLDLLASMK